MREKNRKEINKNEEQSGKEKMGKGRKRGREEEEMENAKQESQRCLEEASQNSCSFRLQPSYTTAGDPNSTHLLCTVLTHASFKATVGQE